MPSASNGAQSNLAHRAWVRSYAGKSTEFDQDQPVGGLSRARSDGLAAWAKWHSELSEQSISPEKIAWYSAIERARVETLAARELRGVKANLAAGHRDSHSIACPADLYSLAVRVFSESSSSSDRTGAPGASMPRSEPGGPFGLGAAVLRRIGFGRVFPRFSWVRGELAMLSEFVSDQVRFQEMAGLVLDSLPDWVDAEHPPDEQGAHRPIASDEQSGDGAEVHDDLVGSDASFVDTDGAAGLVQQKASYSVFSSALDETGPARRWLTANDHALLSLLDSPDRLRIQHLARELQRHLLAQARPSWAFDCDEGVLDSRRLSRLVTSASDRRVFRQEIGREKSEACVCFLIDLSGSMSHERRVMAALTLDFVLQTLDQCSISSEALAFTTRFFAPNPLADEWRRRGEPTRPGRLNAVRHVVLKAKHEGWKATRNALALLLKKDFGRENLDGEALDWAARRLSRSPERKKFLIVFSDGEPYDEATDLANGSLYLEDHLREVIKAVEASGIVLSAIGFGSNVTRFFGNAITVRRAEDLPSKVFDRVGELLMPRFKGAIRP